MFDKSYIILMKNSLIELVAEQPLMKVVKSLLVNLEPLHLREVAVQCRLSVSGTADILRRLSELKLVSFQRQKNRKYYSLNISDGERFVLNEMFSFYDRCFIRKRASQISVNALEKIEWQEEACEFYDAMKHKDVL